jgi:hypothetical protein
LLLVTAAEIDGMVWKVHHKLQRYASKLSQGVPDSQGTSPSIGTLDNIGAEGCIAGRHTVFVQGEGIINP